MSNILSKIDILILCGGLGTRLSSVVSDRPKPMAHVGDKPFLEIVVDELMRQGFRRIIFCTGHMGEQIKKYFGKNKNYNGVEFVFSREKSPLGTGGAVKRALPLVKNDKFFVINGDTFSNIDFNDFYLKHAGKSSPLSMALTKGSGSDYGNIILAKNDTISSFIEKNEEGKGVGLINSGCYLVNRDIQNYFPDGDAFSLERDIFPRLAGNSHGFVFDGKFLDIGTPERYASAEEFLS